MNSNKIELYRTIYYILIPIFVIIGTYLWVKLPLSTQDNVICGMIIYLVVGSIIERIVYWKNKKENK